MAEKVQEGQKCQIDKFDFCQLIQAYEDIEEFAQGLKSFLEENLPCKELEATGRVIVRSLKAVLDTIPGFYRETASVVLAAL